MSGVGSASGGNVTFVSAPADTLQIVIVRAVPLTQDTDYVSNDSFPAETHEGALDTLMLAVQDIFLLVSTISVLLLLFLGTISRDSSTLLLK